jgi:hypothetical protein
VPPPDYVPAPSKDPALTALAQLGALRLGASRALISLLDGQNQYILAEATSHMPLRSNGRHNASNQLWLGNVRIPRSSGVCERVLALTPEDPASTERSLAIIIDDMRENEQLGKRSYITDGPKWRFYAGVPMISADGAVIGAFCVFDDKVRDGLPSDSLALLHDMAATAVEHLATYKLREDHRRGERMVRGLTSFLAGATSLQQPGHESVVESPETTVDKEKTSDARGEPTLDVSAYPESTARPAAQHRGKSASSILQESILPPNAKSMFSRAANIIRETSELDGVVIFDALFAGAGAHQNQPQARARNASPSHSRDEPPPSTLADSQQHNAGSTGAHDTSSSESSSSSSRRDRQRCQILGFSCIGQSSIAGNIASAGLQSLTEYDLKKMLNMYGSGKIINFGISEAMTSSDESAKDDSSADDKPKNIRRRSAKREGMRRIMNVAQRVAPGAQSLCFLPLWDYEQSRWFAGCLLWTTQQDRLLSPALDLVYLKAFGNSVMTELSRLQEVASNKSKTTFAASISHELRSVIRAPRCTECSSHDYPIHPRILRVQCQPEYSWIQFTSRSWWRGSLRPPRFLDDRRRTGVSLYHHGDEVLVATAPCQDYTNLPLLLIVF